MKPYPELAKSSNGSRDSVQPVAIVANVRALPAGTNRGGTITVGGAHQQLAAANEDRTFLRGQNVSDGDLWISEFTAVNASAASPSFVVPAKATFEVSTNQKVTIFGATTGQGWSATEG